jgi:hypothetical protein
LSSGVANRFGCGVEPAARNRRAAPTLQESNQAGEKRVKTGKGQKKEAGHYSGLPMRTAR